MFLVVSEATCPYKAPADYADLLTIRTWIEKVGGASLRHGYEVVRDTTILASGTTVVVCVDREGKVQRMPDWLRGTPASR